MNEELKERAPGCLLLSPVSRTWTLSVKIASPNGGEGVSSAEKVTAEDADSIGRASKADDRLSMSLVGPSLDCNPVMTALSVPNFVIACWLLTVYLLSLPVAYHANFPS